MTPYLTIFDGKFELLVKESVVLSTEDPNEVAEYILNQDYGFFLKSSALHHSEEYSMPAKTVERLFELIEQPKHEDAYNTFLSPLHRELILRGLQIAGEAEDLWGLEDRERAEAALNAIKALLEGFGTRDAVIASEKRIRAAASKYHNRAGKRPWAEQHGAVLLVAAVARLAASEYPKTQAQIFEQCFNLRRDPCRQTNL